MSNLLQYEDSPYLQQHKDNPIHWFPWCDGAFEKALHENKAIFISIGYSSCHWCHVMEHEVFENTDIADFMNDHFVCIKVDREERPDIDKYYQDLHNLLNRRSGGWPLSVFCTPQNKPFYAATYIPPYDQQQMMGFSTLTSIIAKKIEENDLKLFQNADEILTFMKPKNTPIEATHLNLGILNKFVQQIEYSADATNGGFSKSPKFPHVSTLQTLLTIEKLHPTPSAKRILETTLNGMILGGMYDLVDGGFCRYSTDEKWLVPHFEKMTYDNALLCSLYSDASSYFNNSSWLTIAQEIADFMLEFMSEDHLFYSASDADSEGVEGEYFVYTYQELIDQLAHHSISLDEAKQYFEINENGNFEHKIIMRLLNNTRPRWFNDLTLSLKKLRTKRTYPFIDKKIITAWNAMMIEALFKLSAQLPNYRIHAENALNSLWDTMFINDTLMHSTLIKKSPKIDAFLEDYSYLASALLQAYQSTFDELYLIKAQLIVNQALERFYDQGKWYFSKGDFSILAECEDSTYPSALSMMVRNLLTLGLLVDSKYRHFAFKTLEFNSLNAMKTPVYFPLLTEQIIRYLHSERIIKSSENSLNTALAQINYPFTFGKKDSSVNKGFMICGESSCFSLVEDEKELSSAIEKTL